VPLASESTTPDSRLIDTSPGADVRGSKTYPFALVLRLRVLQVGKTSKFFDVRLFQIILCISFVIGHRCF